MPDDAGVKVMWLSSARVSVNRRGVCSSRPSVRVKMRASHLPGVAAGEAHPITVPGRMPGRGESTITISRRRVAEYPSLSAASRHRPGASPPMSATRAPSAVACHIPSARPARLSPIAARAASADMPSITHEPGPSPSEAKRRRCPGAGIAASSAMSVAAICRHTAVIRAGIYMRTLSRVSL